MGNPTTGKSPHLRVSTDRLHVVPNQSTDRQNYRKKHTRMHGEA